MHYGTVVIKPVPPILKDFNALQGLVFDDNYHIIPVLNIPDIIRRFKVVNVYEVKNLEIQKMPKLIQFLIKDKHYCFVIITFLPVLIILFYFRRMA